MFEFENRIFINRPPQEVFDVITDPAKLPRWQSSVESAEWTSAGPVQTGSTMRAAGRFLGRRIETELQFTACEPPYNFSWKAIRGPFPLEVINELEPQGEGTLLRSRSRAEFGGFFKVAEGLAGKQVQKQTDANFDTLKLLMESEQL